MRPQACAHRLPGATISLNSPFGSCAGVDCLTPQVSHTHAKHLTQQARKAVDTRKCSGCSCAACSHGPQPEHIIQGRHHCCCHLRGPAHADLAHKWAVVVLMPEGHVHTEPWLAWRIHCCQLEVTALPLQTQQQEAAAGATRGNQGQPGSVCWHCRPLALSAKM